MSKIKYMEKEPKLTSSEEEKQLEQTPLIKAMNLSDDWKYHPEKNVSVNQLGHAVVEWTEALKKEEEF